MGQRQRARSRQRFIGFPAADGAERLTLERESVTASGGGYFFAAPISAVASVLSDA